MAQKYCSNYEYMFQNLDKQYNETMKVVSWEFAQKSYEDD